jgi:Flp pilus assembly secretin CpaC
MEETKMKAALTSISLVGLMLAYSAGIEAVAEENVSGARKAQNLTQRGYIEVPQRVKENEDANVDGPNVQVLIESRLIELHVGRMRALGFEFSVFSDAVDEKSGLRPLGDVTQDSKNIANVIEAMRENGLAATLAEPTLVTVNHRQATISIRNPVERTVSDESTTGKRVSHPKGITLNYCPHVLSDKRIRLDVGLTLEPINERANPSDDADVQPRTLDTSVEMAPGRHVIFLVTPGTLGAKNSAEETYVLVARTELVSRVAEKKSPDALQR